MSKKISMEKSHDLNVTEAQEAFIKKCRVRNLTENSIRSYEDKLKPFFAFVGAETPVSEISSDTVDDFTLAMREKGNVNDISINSYLRSVRAFLYFCMSKNYMEEFKVSLTKAEKKIKETYTDQELEILLKRPDTKKCTFADYKTWVFENYLVATGNRISTALGLHISDIDFNGGIIIIRKVKNRKQQIIPLSNALSSVLSEYLQIREGKPDDYLFCDKNGDKPDIRTYQDLVARYNRRRGVEKTSVHLFRHTFAKKWILAGGDVFRLQKILGHSSLAVTQEYVDLFGGDLQIDFDRFNPLDKFAGKGTKIKMN